MSAVQESLFESVTRKPKPKSVHIVNLRMVREKTVKYESAVSTQVDTVNMVKELFKNSYREMVVVIGLDWCNKPTIIHVVGVGSPNSAPVCISSIFKPLLLSNSSSCILVHNHPASTMSPSECDKEITRRVFEVGKLLEIALVDHLILNADASDYYSMRNAPFWPR